MPTCQTKSVFLHFLDLVCCVFQSEFNGHVSVVFYVFQCESKRHASLVCFRVRWEMCVTAVLKPPLPNVLRTNYSNSTLDTPVVPWGSCSRCVCVSLFIPCVWENLCSLHRVVQRSQRCICPIMASGQRHWVISIFFILLLLWVG